MPRSLFPGFQTLLLMGVSALAATAAAATAAAAPNIVLVVSDDMGYSDLGCYGGEIDTPRLDELAAEGLRFTDYYVNNMCWPTRASLMTGLYPATALPRKGRANGGLHPGATTLSAALREADYTTLMSGKWHLSDPAGPDGPNAPHHRGFDRFYGTIHGASDFFAPADLQLDGESRTGEWEGRSDYYYTDAITDRALAFLEEADHERPFFLYVAYTAAHWPLHAHPEDIEAYRGRYAMGWDEMRIRRHARMKELGLVDPDWPLSPRHPDVPAWEEVENREWQERRMEVYAAQVTCMDRNIGRIVDFLRESGEFEETLFLYQHDNGGCHVEYGEERTGSWTREFTTDGRGDPIVPGNVPGVMPGPQTTFQSYGYGWANASNTPFRLFKQHDHEGGTRSPLVVSWPAAIDETRSGTLVRQVAHAVDLMPTLLDAAGVDRRPQRPLDYEGVSLLPVLRGEDSAGEIERELFWSHARGRAVRRGEWKLVSQRGSPWELYDLAQDGTELVNRIEDEPAVAADLEARFDAWRERTVAAGEQTAGAKGDSR